MSLNWNLTNVKNNNELCFVETGEVKEDGSPVKRMNPVTETIIFMTMTVDIGLITEKNYKEFFRRAFAYQSMFGGLIWQNDLKEYRLVSLKEIREHVGLRTNVLDLSPPTWNRRFMKMVELESNAAIRIQEQAEQKLLETPVN